jgi:hypothetical protein
MNIPPKDASSQAAISITVTLVISGLDIKTSKVVIIPKDIPTTKPENSTIKL